MTTNPPPDPAAEDAIDEILHNMFTVKTHNNASRSYHIQYDKAKQAILALIAKLELEARIAELETLQQEMYRRASFELQATAPGVLVDPNRIKVAVFDKRLAQLKAQDDPDDYYALTGDFRP